jgi:hypothetical protein
VVTNAASGGYEFRVYLPHASCVELLGTFNGWEPALAVSLRGDAANPGWWVIETMINPGEHEFCYLINGCTWLPDYAAGGVRRNTQGRWISQLSISAVESREDVVALTVALHELPGRDAEAKPMKIERGERRARGEDAGSSRGKRAVIRT